MSESLRHSKSFNSNCTAKTNNEIWVYFFNNRFDFKQIVFS